jgi:methylthioribose-1-phosphate isomerase
LAFGRNPSVGYLLASNHNPTMTANLQSLKYSNEGGAKPALAVLDQLLIPHEKVYIDIPDVEAAWTVIRTMQIRGR